MAIEALAATKGKMYRRTRNEKDGGYFRTSTKTIQKHIAHIQRKVRRTALTTREVSLILEHQAKPTWVLMRRYLRGTDPFTGDKYEVKHHVLVPPDLRLREIAKPPGYKTKPLR